MLKLNEFLSGRTFQTPQHANKHHKSPREIIYNISQIYLTKEVPFARTTYRYLKEL